MAELLIFNIARDPVIAESENTEELLYLNFYETKKEQKWKNGGSNMLLW